MQHALAESTPSATSAMAQGSSCFVLVSQPEVSFLMSANLISSYRLLFSILYHYKSLHPTAAPVLYGRN